MKNEWYGVIDYLYRNPPTGFAAVCESIPYRTRSEYEAEIKASAYIGRPISAR